MPIALRLRNELRHPLPAVPGLAIHREFDPMVMALMQQRSVEEMHARFDAGHRAYVAVLNGEPAAWGWVATERATIGELKVAFVVPAGHRYLWNFVTLAPFRGRGIYPRLVDAIVEIEATDVASFWIAYAPENHASGAGIRRAGFALVAELSFDQEGTPVVKGLVAGGGEAASTLLGLPDTSASIAQCWKCARGPSPAASGCATGSCSCDYQRPEKSCA